jgi:multisubunit Na+/H+ antiporter MnhC subunit
MHYPIAIYAILVSEIALFSIGLYLIALGVEKNVREYAACGGGLVGLAIVAFAITIFYKDGEEEEEEEEVNSENPITA